MSLCYILQREPSGPESTIGAVTVLDEFKWFACEDVVREPLGRPVLEDPGSAAANLAAWVASWKIAGVTAIPSGLYRLAFTFSQRFQRETLQLLNVPGFSGIRIHPGNTDADTEGCLLPGMERQGEIVIDSRTAVARWEAEVRQGPEAWIEIRNAA